MEQACLSNSWLARHQHDLEATSKRFLEVVPEANKFLLPPSQQCNTMRYVHRLSHAVLTRLPGEDFRRVAIVSTPATLAYHKASRRAYVLG